MTLLDRLSRASHAHQRGSRIAVTARLTDSEAVLSVSDNGQGIPAQELEAVFERYHRVASLEAGSGLGLAIAKGIVELHGGRIWVESKPGHGTTFHIALPGAEIGEGP